MAQSDKEQAPEVQVGPWRNLPDGFSPEQSLWIMSDIHGCVEELRMLLEHRPPESRFVFLGDAIDRGPYPARCIKFLTECGAECLWGNHEGIATVVLHPDRNDREMLDSHEWEVWGYNGRKSTYYDVLDNVNIPDEHSETWQRDALLKFLQPYFDRCGRYVLSGNILLCHAGLPKDADESFFESAPEVAGFSEDSWQWYRPEMLDAATDYATPRSFGGRSVLTVFGHTPQEPEEAVSPYALAADFGYYLKSALQIEPGSPGRFRYFLLRCDSFSRGRNEQPVRHINGRSVPWKYRV